jgi:hypothetical protein
MSGFDNEGSKDYKKANPQKPGRSRFSLPTIHELRVFEEKLTEDGKPAMEDKVKRGINLPRSKSVKPEAMKAMVKQNTEHHAEYDKAPEMLYSSRNTSVNKDVDGNLNLKAGALRNLESDKTDSTDTSNKKGSRPRTPSQ